MNATVKTVILWLVIIVITFLLFELFRTTRSSEEISYSEFLERVNGDGVQHVEIRGADVRGMTKPDATHAAFEFTTVIPANYPATFDLLRAHHVNITILRSDSTLLQALASWAPMLFLVGLWFLVSRRLRVGR